MVPIPLLVQVSTAVSKIWVVLRFVDALDCVKALNSPAVPGSWERRILKVLRYHWPFRPLRLGGMNEPMTGWTIMAVWVTEGCKECSDVFASDGVVLFLKPIRNVDQTGIGHLEKTLVGRGTVESAQRFDVRSQFDVVKHRGVEPGR